jgi:hypothetical protein
VCDDAAVAQFVFKLAERSLPVSPDGDEASFSADQLRDFFWDWDAPGPRFAKLLWQFVKDDASDEEFDRRGLRDASHRNSEAAAQSSFVC